MYAFHLFGTIDSFLLAMMAIDRFMAIVHPLCYLAIMSPRVWGLLVGALWLITNLQSLVYTCLMAQLTFCVGSEIPHFFCDLIPLPKLSGSDTHTNEPVIFPFGIILGISCLACILFSYTSIFQAVFKILSAQVQWKAFSTCSSHLTVVSLYYGTIFTVYLQPASPAPPRRTRQLLCCVGWSSPC